MIDILDVMSYRNILKNLDVNNCNLCYETNDDAYCRTQYYCKEVSGIEADGVVLPRFNQFTLLRSAKQAIPI